MTEYVPPQPKEKISVAVDKDVLEWMNANNMNRSHFINQLARSYMIRDNEAKRRGKKLRHLPHDESVAV